MEGRRGPKWFRARPRTYGRGGWRKCGGATRWNLKIQLLQEMHRSRTTVLNVGWWRRPGHNWSNCAITQGECTWCGIMVWDGNGHNSPNYNSRSRQRMLFGTVQKKSHAPRHLWSPAAETVCNIAQAPDILSRLIRREWPWRHASHEDEIYTI